MPPAAKAKDATTISHHTIPLSVAKRALAVALQINQPTILWGEPGIGKTAFIRSLWRALYPGNPCITLIPALHDPADINGYPFAEAGTMKMLPAEWAMTLRDHPGPSLLFLDELSRAPYSVQGACLRLIAERTAGATYMGDDVRVVSAANPAASVSGALDLSADMSNRFLHIPWPVDHKAWIDGMLLGWPDPTPERLPGDWVRQQPLATSLVAGFISTRPAMLQNEPAEDAARSKPWPSQRTWDYGTRLLAACMAIKASTDVELALLSGTVGVGPASEFANWRRELDLPDPEKLLAKPSEFKVPQRGDQQYACLVSVVAAVLNNFTKPRVEAAWDIMATAAEKGMTDVAAGAVRSLASAVIETEGMPLPAKQIRAFLPILKKAGLIR